MIESATEDPRLLDHIEEPRAGSASGSEEPGQMVYIKKILVKNFKSFGGLVKLNLEPGFNVVTGPNGSGKSNIIDAVQFVLGELSPRRMRVSDQAGLIFDGADQGSSQKAEMAHVTVYFDNTDRGVALDKSIVSVSRKVDRQGNSKYFLNGRRTSRRVALDLLEMAGISPGGYNIVLQGTATRLSDLTPQERMTALEDLIGITEYDVKKANARVRLTEAERKIEVASARIDEMRKRVSELEAQRNDALRYKLLSEDERRLNALKLSHRLSQLETEIEKIGKQLSDHRAETGKLDEERAGLASERDAAKERWEEFNRDATEKGNTRLPMLKSDLVARRTLENSLTTNLKEIDSKKQVLQKSIKEKETEIEELKKEAEEKRRKIIQQTQLEEQISSEISEKESQFRELNSGISTLKEAAESNQKRLEALTESLVPHQESLSGYDIEINRKILRSNSLTEKIDENDRKKAEVAKGIDSLRQSLEKAEQLNAEEAKRLEEMLGAVEDQVARQRNLRNTIESASKLAKEAEISVTQFSAKRDLWQKIVTDEKAQERIREMGEAGALKGYHGPLRSLVKIDLKYQRAVTTSSNGWINAFVFDDTDTVLECIEQLKKTKLGTTKFLPLNSIRQQEPLLEITGDGVIGSTPSLIRYDEKLSPVINLIWGDTVLVANRSAALFVVERGYRAVTLSGDVYEPQGGIIGGFYRNPPDLSKLIPSEESVNMLSFNLKTLRERLLNRMGDLKLSGSSMRKFTELVEGSSKNIENIDDQIRETKENIGRQEEKIRALDDKNREIEKELSQEQGLIATLQERKEKILQEIERVKAEISELRELSKPSDVAGLDLQLNALNGEMVHLQEKRSQLRSDISILTNLVNNFLEMKIAESDEQIRKWQQNIEELNAEIEGTRRKLDEASASISELESALGKITADVESTSQIITQHQNTVRLIEKRIEQNDQRRSAIASRIMELSINQEKLRLQHDQSLGELQGLGFESKLSTEGVDLDRVERALSRVKSEKASLGAINQLAEAHYAEVVGNYKQMSIRINELEEEKSSILRFIDEIEREKQEHFMKAFHEVCENFSNIFARLTGGGDGRLEFQKPEDPFAGGVDLYVQFPGKPMRLASGASGGERSVAAIAYLLAVQRFLKAPFYLFDEIDAHLDDLNITRLSEVLKENAVESQFIVVTLKDVMVHNADRIYGVFNQNGRSRALALPMKMEVVA